MTEQTYIRPRTIDTAEVAKLMRRQLKLAFPQLPARFWSVRIDRYAGGSSVAVNWTDGPTEDQVKKITHAFGSARFEGMSDCSYSSDQWWCEKHGVQTAETHGGDKFCETGPEFAPCCDEVELVHMGAGYIHESRALSPEFEVRLEAEVRREAGMDETVRDQRETLPERSMWWRGDYSEVRTGVRQLADQTPA